MLQEGLLALLKPQLYGLLHAVGECFLSGDESVEIVPQEIRAVDAAVAVEYSEVGWLLPISHVLRL